MNPGFFPREKKGTGCSACSYDVFLNVERHLSIGWISQQGQIGAEKRLPEMGAFFYRPARSRRPRLQDLPRAGSEKYSFLNVTFN
jgi:hypothetical protein